MQRASHDASQWNHPALPPGGYLRMPLVGCFEGTDSERGSKGHRVASPSWREFLRLGSSEPVADHSWLSGPRSRLPLEVHTAIFVWWSRRLVERGLVQANRIGIDASPRSRPTGRARRRVGSIFLASMAIRLDRQGQGKRLSNRDWTSPTSSVPKIAKMKNGHMNLVDNAHIIDVDSGAIVATEIHPADHGDTVPLPATLEAAESNLMAVDAAPIVGDRAGLMADEGYHSCAGPKNLEEPDCREQGAERQPPARRSRRPAGRLPRLGLATLGCGQRSVPTPRRTGRAQLCPHPRGRGGLRRSWREHWRI